MFKNATEETFKVWQAACLCVLSSTQEALLLHHKYSNTMVEPQCARLNTIKGTVYQGPRHFRWPLAVLCAKVSLWSPAAFLLFHHLTVLSVIYSDGNNSSLIIMLEILFFSPFGLFLYCSFLWVFCWWSFTSRKEFVLCSPSQDANDPFLAVLAYSKPMWTVNNFTVFALQEFPRKVLQYIGLCNLQNHKWMTK